MKHLDELQFEKIYNDNIQMIYHLVYSYLHNRDDALDISQEVFLSYLAKKPNIENPNEIKFWLIRVAINKSINLLNYRKRHKIIFDDEIINSLSSQENKEENTKMYSLICNLDPKYKTILLLYYYEDIQTSEIARILHMKESTVRMRLHRARAILKNQLERETNG